MGGAKPVIRANSLVNAVSATTRIYGFNAGVQGLRVTRRNEYAARITVTTTNVRPSLLTWQIQAVFPDEDRSTDKAYCQQQQQCEDKQGQFAKHRRSSTVIKTTD